MKMDEKDDILTEMWTDIREYDLDQIINTIINVRYYGNLDFDGEDHNINLY